MSKIEDEKIEDPRSWICFADEQSKSNFSKALAGERNQLGRKPLVIITGDRPGCGKSILAKFLLNSLYGESVVAMRPRKKANWDALIPCLEGQDYLFLDNVYGDIGAESLMNLATSSEFQFRKMRSHEIGTAALDLMIVVTCNGLVELGEDLVRRAWVVRLGEPDGERGKASAVEPPKDGRWYFASGNISRVGAGRASVTPFESVVRYVRGVSFEGWLDRNDMSLKVLTTDELYFHGWKQVGAVNDEVQLSGKSNLAAFAVGMGCVEAAQEARAQEGYQAYVAYLRGEGHIVPDWHEVPQDMQEAFVRFSNKLSTPPMMKLSPEMGEAKQDPRYLKIDLDRCKLESLSEMPEFFTWGAVVTSEDGARMFLMHDLATQAGLYLKGKGSK